MTDRAIWYLLSGSGLVLLVLLTATVCLGVLNVSRFRVGGWTRTVTSLVHRNLSLLSLAFLGVHIVTAVSDRYVSIPLTAAVLPGTSHWSPLWVGMGALAVDLLLAVVVTSLVRTRIPLRGWRAVHRLAYLSWPVAVAHAVGAGSNTGRPWTTAVYAACGLAVAVAVSARLVMARRRQVALPAPSPSPPPAVPDAPARHLARSSS